jgi:hypothetical protein
LAPVFGSDAAVYCNAALLRCSIVPRKSQVKTRKQIFFDPDQDEKGRSVARLRRREIEPPAAAQVGKTLQVFVTKAAAVGYTCGQFFSGHLRCPCPDP